MKQAILAIDSQPTWLRFCQSVLDENDYEGLMAQDCSSALELLRTETGNHVKLIILDVKSFELYGNSLENLSHDNGEYRRPVVVVFPTGLSIERVKKAFKAGAADCIDKPYDEITLIAFVEQMLAERRIAELPGKTDLGKSKGVLIVEDDSDWMETLLKYLPSSIDKIEKVSEYQNALEVLLAQSFDLAILDLRLVDTDDQNFQGMDLVKLIREKDKEREAHTAIIIISAYGTPEYMREAYRTHDVFYFFDKRFFSPINYQDAIAKAFS